MTSDVTNFLVSAASNAAGMSINTQTLHEHQFELIFFQKLLDLFVAWQKNCINCFRWNGWNSWLALNSEYVKLLRLEQFCLSITWNFTNNIMENGIKNCWGGSQFLENLRSGNLIKVVVFPKTSRTKMYVSFVQLFIIIHAFFISNGFFRPRLRCYLAKSKIPKNWPYPTWQKGVKNTVWEESNHLTNSEFSSQYFPR